MRITLRLILSLIVAVATVSSLSAYVQVSQERQRQQEELERRSRLLAESFYESVEPLVERGALKQLGRLVEKFGNGERLAGVAVYDTRGDVLAVTASLATVLSTPPEVVSDSLTRGIDAGRFDTLQGKEMHVYALPLRGQDTMVGALVLVHDAAYIQAQLASIQRHTFLRILLQMLLITIIILFIVRWSIAGPIAQMAEWMKQLRSGEAGKPHAVPKADLFAPIAREVSIFARHLSDARAAAEKEATLRRKAETLWTPVRLKEHVKAKLGGRPLFVISNRQPYMHQRRGRRVECVVPAGGLVTALDPVLRACGGTWIAQGAGDADWEFVDEQHRLKVPPDDPHYILKLVALTKEEENGYYYGFSNEGLWPLCHIAHTRPLFQSEDWVQYQKANERFARAALEEIESIEEPCVFIQDYHFALLPQLLKQERPEARIGLFWHIPWPNPEAFGICPWQRDLLDGMLGADLIGFHTQFHCNNFLDTVDRSLESRTNWERFSVSRAGHTTLVKPFPISVAFPETTAEPGSWPDRTTLLKEIGITATYLGVGVERIDYTKGILERFWALERFLEKYPAYQGEFTFVQLGAPSRTHIKRYHDFLAEVESEVERINWRFKSNAWRPITFLKKLHSHDEIMPYYKAADICLVTSLHDGMNLVAKEFVAARDDEGGVLILSRFTGAARELRDALIVNPYDLDQTAEAIHYALKMSLEEKMSRMRRLRETVREHNIYRWAGNLIEELTHVRIGSPLVPHA